MVPDHEAGAKPSVGILDPISESSARIGATPLSILVLLQT
jgi:hypothetical protein